MEGRLIGNANARYVRLKKTAVVHGNITCKCFEIDMGAIFLGKLNSISTEDAQPAIDQDGFIIDEEYLKLQQIKQAQGKMQTLMIITRYFLFIVTFKSHT